MNTTDCWREAYTLITRGEVERAMELCAKAPCADSLDCQRFLGREYFIRREMEIALQWYTRAADQGDRGALYGLGCIFFEEKKYPQAMQYFERAADEDFPLGYYRIGHLYDQGLGVSQNTEKASEYFKKGASHGHFGCKRGLIEHKLRSKSFLKRLLARVELVGQGLKGFVIALRNINDPRLSGFQNVFEKKRT